MAKKKKAKKILPSAVRSTETPVYDQLVADTGFAPHTTPPPGWRNMLGGAEMLEDNFS